MTAVIPIHTELSVSDELDNVSVREPAPPRRQEHKLDLDDAFSLHEEDDAAMSSFDFSADSFMKELQLRPSLGTEDCDGEIEDMQESQHTSYDSTDASVSTLDIDGVTESRHTILHTPPHPSSSTHSLSSEAQPPTPPDDLPTSTAHISSHLTNLSLSPPLEPSKHAMHNVEPHAYPNVIIDASKTPTFGVPNFPSSASQQTTDSQDSSRSSTSEHAPDPTESASRDDSFKHVTQSGGISPTSPPAGHHSSQSVSSVTAAKTVRPSGPSVLQTVVSKTRPPHLPPKQKDEDDKHNKEWEEMMARSRFSEQKRREALEARRLARELSVEANTSLWERSVLSDWKNAVKNPQLRKLWWDGVPTKLRSTVWERAVGNSLALSRDTYTSTLSRAKKLLATQRFPSKALSQLEADISHTLPELHIFHPVNGPLSADLRDLLCAWVVSRVDEGLGYVDGIARIGGMLLLNLTGPSQAFLVMRNLLETGCLRAFYGGPGARDDVEAYYRIFDTLLADIMPKVYFNFKQHQISPAAYLPDWLLPLFLDHLPLEACSRIWDVLLLEGDAFLFRAALAILGCLESRLFFPDRAELLAVLKGESSAARQVALRSGGHSPIAIQDGVYGPRYEIYRVDEETVWERVVEMEESFKESTWQRLIQRELPEL